MYGAVNVEIAAQEQLNSTIPVNFDWRKDGTRYVNDTIGWNTESALLHHILIVCILSV